MPAHMVYLYMLTIDFPAKDFKIKKKGDTAFIFDGLRKKWLELTPEEWVRQNFIQYLVKGRNYPSSCIAQEKVFMVGEMKKRFDIVVYLDLKPWLLVECKKSRLPLQEKVLTQALIYNQALQAEFLVITNGQQTIAYQLTQSTIELLSAIPAWPKQ